MERKIYTARLVGKVLLSEPAQCYHLEFEVEDVEHFRYEAGQFVSMLATDSRGKNQTRAYSIASASRRNRFDLCVNRVENGFFSNLLCDLDLGATVPFHGAHGLFVLRPPFTDIFMIATGTGIAPMRAFVEQLFPDGAEDTTAGKRIWLMYGTRHESDIYYQTYFEKVAAEHPNFHYLPTLSRPREDWRGLRGYVQTHVQEVLRMYPQAEAQSISDSRTTAMHAYICGLNDMVSANRESLTSLGWDKQQIHFERYD